MSAMKFELKRKEGPVRKIGGMDRGQLFKARPGCSALEDGIIYMRGGGNGMYVQILAVAPGEKCYSAVKPRELTAIPVEGKLVVNEK